VIRFTTDAHSRREWLRLGGLAGLGLALPRLRAASSRAPGFGRAKSVLLVFLSGGQSQLETWDMKPDAPVEVRGAFRPIRTTVPGTVVSEHLPHLARLAHRYTIVRNVSHEDADHGSAAYLALTGQYHARRSGNPPVSPADLPTFGAVLHRVRPCRRLPFSAAHLNAPALVPEVPAPGQFAGLLGRKFEPLVIGDVTENPVPLVGLDRQPALSSARLAERRSLLAQVENSCRGMEKRPALLDMEASYRQAYELLSSPKVRQTFDLSREPAGLRDRYGRHRPGQSCLLARRLIEAGLPLVTVIWSHSNRGQDRDPNDTDVYGWDTHNDIFEALKEHLLPRFDRTFAVLLDDLEQRGLLDSTLVVCMGEFGRAPLVAKEKTFAGTTPGRKHWPAAYSVVLAGAGVRQGAVVGATDRRAAYVKGSAVGPWDLAATLYHALGIDPTGHYTDATDRPYPLATGKPVLDLYGK
jgi:hypothetical protein